MQIPVLWQEVLKDVQRVFPSAMIAGGALRDLFYNKPVKDVDIFCNVEESPDDFDTLLMEVFPQLILTQGGGSSRYLGSTEGRLMYGIYQLHIEGITFEFIVTTPEACDVTEFDLSICQATYDGNKVYLTDEFKATAETKIIKVCNINRADRQEERVQRILMKYPDFNVDSSAARMRRIEDTIDFSDLEIFQ